MSRCAAQVTDTLHRLLLENHTKLDTRYEQYYTNHIVYDLYALAALGASPSRLVDCYEYKRRRLAPLRPRMMALSTARHYEPTGKPEYYSSFLDYYDRRVRALGFDATLEQHLPTVFGGLLGAVGHTAIHLGYAVRYRHDAVLAEALAFASCGEQSLVPRADALYEDDDASAAAAIEP
ncbi:hypothetical protein SYNPS1DRAFT_21753, partial [Syncephalis pseudoplumigaleata]